MVSVTFCKFDRLSEVLRALTVVCTPDDGFHVVGLESRNKDPLSVIVIPGVSVPRSQRRGAQRDYIYE